MVETGLKVNVNNSNFISKLREIIIKSQYHGAFLFISVPVMDW